MKSSPKKTCGAFCNSWAFPWHDKKTGHLKQSLLTGICLALLENYPTAQKSWNEWTKQELVPQPKEVFTHIHDTLGHVPRVHCAPHTWIVHFVSSLLKTTGQDEMKWHCNVLGKWHAFMSQEPCDSFSSHKQRSIWLCQLCSRENLTVFHLAGLVDMESSFLRNDSPLTSSHLPFWQTQQRTATCQTPLHLIVLKSEGPVFVDSFAIKR